ncbi:MAG TPA: hypothetical protein PLZ84_00325 [Clostridia bacterium]|nr:hypothetical protein [Clostridia bacterium]
MTDEMCIFDPVLLKLVNFGTYLSAAEYNPGSMAWLAAAGSTWEKWTI